MVSIFLNKSSRKLSFKIQERRLQTMGSGTTTTWSNLNRQQQQKNQEQINQINGMFYIHSFSVIVFGRYTFISLYVYFVYPIVTVVTIL